MIPGRLAALGVAALACGAAWAQFPPQPPSHDGWAPRDKSGKAAPMPFSAFHTPELTYDQVVEKLTAAGCKREDTDKLTRFECEADPNTWYLTLPGKLEHPALLVPADENKDDAPATSHSRPLNVPGEDPAELYTPERREARALWIEAVQPPFKPREQLRPGPVDYNVVLKDAPVSNAQLRGGFTFEQVQKALEGAADCKLQTVPTWLMFDCANSKTRWYLTRAGRPEHPALVLYLGRSHRGGTEDEPYMFSIEKSYAAGRTGSGLPEAMQTWVSTLPGEYVPPSGFDFAGSPFTEEDIEPRGRRSVRLTYDIALRKLTTPGCSRKDVGEYLVFSCNGNPLFFVLSAPELPAHAAMMIVEYLPGANEITRQRTKYFPDLANLARLQMPEYRSATSKWTRGIEYLPLSQLR